MSIALIVPEGQPSPFRPYDFQAEFMAHVQSSTRDRPTRTMAVWPRRHGKDLTALHTLLERAHDRVGMYWHGLPSYEQARKSCWTAFRTDTGHRLMDNVFPREVVKSPRTWAPNGEMLVELRCGSIIQFVGSDTVNNLVGAGLVGLNASEFALWRPSAYNLLRPILRESGGWAAFITTPRGHNHAYKQFLKWSERAKTDPRYLVSWRDIFTAGRYTRAQAEQLLQDERDDGMLEEFIRQEYLCDWEAALVGSYYGDLIEALEKRGALLDFKDERDEVYTVWDLGISDETAIWAFRLTPDGADFLNYYENHSKPLDHYFEVVERWERELGLRYAQHLLPHDAKARTLQTGLSVFDQFYRRYGGQLVSLVPTLGVIDGIQAARRLLQQGVRFHPRCNDKDGVEALRQYHRKYDEDKRAFSSAPEHDWSSNGADAFRYGAVMVNLLRSAAGLRQRRKSLPAPPSARVQLPVSMDQLWKDNEVGRRGRRRA